MVLFNRKQVIVINELCIMNYTYFGDYKYLVQNIICQFNIICAYINNVQWYEMKKIHVNICSVELFDPY